MLDEHHVAAFENTEAYPGPAPHQEPDGWARDRLASHCTGAKRFKPGSASADFHNQERGQIMSKPPGKAFPIRFEIDDERTDHVFIGGQQRSSSSHGAPDSPSVIRFGGPVRQVGQGSDRKLGRLLGKVDFLRSEAQFGLSGWLSNAAGSFRLAPLKCLGPDSVGHFVSSGAWSDLLTGVSHVSTSAARAAESSCRTFGHPDRNRRRSSPGDTQRLEGSTASRAGRSPPAPSITQRFHQHQRGVRGEPLSAHLPASRAGSDGVRRRQGRWRVDPDSRPEIRDRPDGGRLAASRSIAGSPRGTSRSRFRAWPDSPLGSHRSSEHPRHVRAGQPDGPQ